MSLAPLRLVPDSEMAYSRRRTAPVLGQPRHSLAQVLLGMGALSSSEVLHLQQEATAANTELGRFLLIHRKINEDTLATARALQWRIQRIDLCSTPPDVRLIDMIGASNCLKHGIVPWQVIGGAAVVATPNPENVQGMNIGGVRVLPAVAPLSEIQQTILAYRSRQLVRRAETRVLPGESCRDWPLEEVQAAICVLGLCALAWVILSPVSFILAVLAWTVLTMLAGIGLKVAAAWLYVAKGSGAESNTSIVHLAPKPKVSILVPLLRERRVAERLIRCLGQLTYPRELLNVCLVVESDDEETQAAINRVEMPSWFQVVEVPRGSIKTKPRALNFALDFCDGEIVGVYDAEDRPERDQIEKIVDRFRRCNEDVACLQGRLDYYNSHQNWLSRCFTIEYATWFRIILPGLERLGLAVPLGGTTVFFRRSALEAMGGWDAHNVTEDADLGMRLARYGFRTELVDTVTYEEANCRLWPWIKQRSRWLKGFAITYAAHMRSPSALLEDLGPWKFFGFQLLFLGTLSQFLLAPVLWTFWPLLFGQWHPFVDVAGAGGTYALIALFLFAEALAIAVAILAVWARGTRTLAIWTPTLMGYFPLATLAAFKGIWELVRQPFYWDKTEHGLGPN